MATAGLPITTNLPSPIARRQLTLWPLVMVMFFTVSGGPYGLEELVSQSGAGMALLLIVVTPFIWSIPTSLMVAELSSMMPVEGGYYAWVKKALGPFWGFQEGWWSWLSSFVDMAIYPVLFASYLSALLEQAGVTVLEEHAWAHWLVTLAVIWPLAYLNIRGAKPVGFSSVLFGVLVLAPFVVLSAIGIGSLLSGEVTPWEPLTPEELPLISAFGLGLFVVMWNYQGWDSVSTVGEEIVRPRRTVPTMLLITVPLVILTYLLPTLAGLIALPDIAAWTEGSFPQIAAAVGGPWLGTWVAIGGLISAVALYSANLLSISRVPFVLAADGYLPPVITRTHPHYGTPWVAIVVCSIIYSVFTISAFATLVVIDVIVYAATLLLEFAALIVLRWRFPDAPRPYRVPGGWPGVILATLLPTALLCLAVAVTLQTEGAAAIVLSLAALATGIVLYPVLRFLVKRDRRDVYVPLPGENTADYWKHVTLPSLVPRARPRWWHER